MSEPQPPPPDPKKSYSWPLIVNLVLLVVGALLTGGVSSLGVIVLVLAIINGVTALLLALTGHRMHYVLAFALSCLLILLIGFGACALILQSGGGLGNMH